MQRNPYEVVKERFGYVLWRDCHEKSVGPGSMGWVGRLTDQTGVERSIYCCSDNSRVKVVGGVGRLLEMPSLWVLYLKPEGKHDCCGR